MPNAPARTRHRISKHFHGRAARLIVAACVASIATAQAKADSKPPSPGTVAYDLLVERPLGLVELASGVAITPVAYPLAALSSDGGEVVEQCVRVPTRSTFTRTLGRLDDDRRSDCSPVAFGIDLTRLSIAGVFRPLAWIFGGSPFSPSGSDDEGIEI